MKIHYLQHVDFEDPSFILSWAKENGHFLTKTMLHENDSMKDMPDFDLLIIMGGPMNIYEYDVYPWLRDEKKLIGTAISDGKFVLGICLGAQLIADVLGAQVTRNTCKEIGWFPIVQSDAIMAEKPFDILPKQYMALHWHGDTFAIPQGALLQGSSAACVNQGFVYKERVIGLQYHIEATGQSVARLIENCGNELSRSAEYIHDKDRIIADTALHAQKAQALLSQLLKRWLS